ncbi:nonsense-mediated mRNA decay factor [Aspergillus luchuensis]|uniref:Nonsense-mediated mRNA decay factor n=1 Tax=Aspergillus kawachii TaxID=1069201 RepID=A0A146FDY1_ASPKA|nr:nonsense-mediated mRNA decay factor [Aspergillus luchuensis]
MWEEREARRERAVEVEVAMEEEDGEDEEVREKEEDGEEEEERGDMMYCQVEKRSHHLIPSITAACVHRRQ